MTPEKMLERIEFCVKHNMIEGVQLLYDLSLRDDFKFDLVDSSDVKLATWLYEGSAPDTALERNAQHWVSQFPVSERAVTGSAEVYKKMAGIHHANGGKL